MRHPEPAFTIYSSEHEKFKEKKNFFNIRISLNSLFVYTAELHDFKDDNLKYFVAVKYCLFMKEYFENSSVYSFIYNLT